MHVELGGLLITITFLLPLQPRGLAEHALSFVAQLPDGRVSTADAVPRGIESVVTSPRSDFGSAGPVHSSTPLRIHRSARQNYAYV